MAQKIEFYPPQLHFRLGACAWITRGFCMMVSIYNGFECLLIKI